jgi:hypothetical protein
MLIYGVITRGIIMGNTQPIKGSGSTPPPQRPRTERTIDFDEVALGQITGTLVRHDQGPSSPTVTPLPGNATVRLMSWSEISALAPPRPKRPKSLEFGPLTSCHSESTVRCSFTVKGVAEDSPFINVIWNIFVHAYATACTCSSRATKEGGVELCFEAHKCQSLHGKAYEFPSVTEPYDLACNLLRNALALGASEHDAEVLSQRDVFAELSKDDWTCQRTLTGIRDRGLLVKRLLAAGHFELAFHLVCDLADASRIAGSYALAFETPEIHALIEGGYPITLREFTHLACQAIHENPNLLLFAHCPVQAGRMLLCSSLDPDFNAACNQTVQDEVFAAIANFRMRRSRIKGANALLQDLFDLPDDVRSEVLIDPTTRRQLLMAFPALEKVTAQIEGNAIDVISDRMKQLQRRGIIFPDQFPFGNHPVEIVGAVVDSASIDLLLELGEVAVLCTGYVNWATGVLQFLSDRVLDDDQIERAVALRNRLLSAVRFHPDREVAAQFDAIKTLTDAAIKELHGNPKSG